jgi:hypothetical protein
MMISISHCQLYVTAFAIWTDIAHTTRNLEFGPLQKSRDSTIVNGVVT